jgi:hypothetical protein
MNTQKLPTIGPEERFYGYITGIGIEHNYDPDTGTPRMYATFENNGEVSVWIVPDPMLFMLLSIRLLNMAESRFEGDGYGYEKLCIYKTPMAWNLDNP